MSAHTENTVVIDAPLELVWRRTNEIESWTELFDEYGEATVLAREGDRVTFRLALHPDENGKVWSWVSERRMDAATHTTLSQRIETGPFKYMVLFWEYTEVPGGVAMRWVQDFEMKPGAPLDDAGMAARINANSPVQQARIKRILESEALVSTVHKGES